MNNQLRSVSDCIRFSSFDRLEIVSSAVITLLVGDEVRIVVTAIRLPPSYTSLQGVDLYRSRRQANVMTSAW